MVGWGGSQVYLPEFITQNSVKLTELLFELLMYLEP